MLYDAIASYGDTLDWRRGNVKLVDRGGAGARRTAKARPGTALAAPNVHPGGGLSPTDNLVNLSCSVPFCRAHGPFPARLAHRRLAPADRSPPPPVGRVPAHGR